MPPDAVIEATSIHPLTAGARAAPTKTRKIPHLLRATHYTVDDGVLTYRAPKSDPRSIAITEIADEHLPKLHRRVRQQLRLHMAHALPHLTEEERRGRIRDLQISYNLVGAALRRLVEEV